MWRPRFVVVSLLCLVLLAASAAAQEVGSIAGLDGTVEVIRAGVPGRASIGMPLRLGDEIRTKRPGRARIVLRDDSVVNVGSDSQLVIAEQVFQPAQSTLRTILRLAVGKIRVLVGEYYTQPGSVYQVNTPTAVSGVRGTEFVITYDPVAQVSDVVGVTGTVAVHSVMDLVGHEVLVHEQELSVVGRGMYPTPAIRIPDKLFRQYIDDVSFIGDGRSEGLALVAAPIPIAELIPPGAGPGAGQPGSLAVPAAGGGGAGWPQFPTVGDGPGNSYPADPSTPTNSIPPSLSAELGVKF